MRHRSDPDKDRHWLLVCTGNSGARLNCNSTAAAAGWYWVGLYRQQLLPTAIKTYQSNKSINIIYNARLPATAAMQQSGFRVKHVAREALANLYYWQVTYKTSTRTWTNERLDK